MDYSKIILEGMRLVNFQSWKDEVANFTNGLNVIIAENETGKSVIFKALELTTVPNKIDSEKREDYIRGDCAYACIYYMFNDNCVYKVMFDTKNTKYFKVEDIRNPKFEFVGATLPDDLRDRLSVVFRGDTVGNIIDSQKDMFLVNSDSVVDCSVIDMLVSHEGLENLIDVVSNERLPYARDILRRIKSKKSGYEELIECHKYKDVMTEESNLNFCKKAITALEYLYDIKDKLESVRPYGSLDKSCINLMQSSSVMLEFYNNLKNINECTICGIEYLPALDYVSTMSTLHKNMELLYPSKFLETIEYITLIDSLMNSLSNASKIISIDSEISELKKITNIEGGEQFNTCPLHGSIKFIDGECIPISN